MLQKPLIASVDGEASPTRRNVMKEDLTMQQLRYRQMHRLDQPNSEPHAINGGGAGAALRFRQFCVLPRARQLLSNGHPVEIGSRALDLLMVLMEAPGTLVTKKEILTRVWPSTLVEESNLRVQMSTLRKILGKDRDVIKNVPGRGYVFTVEVTVGAAESDAWTSPNPEPTPPPYRLASPTFDSSNDNRSMERRSAVSREEVPSTVIVIDDDRDVCEALDGFFRAVGLRVELFLSVQQFLGSTRSTLPGCLVVDASLPGQSGLDFHEDLLNASGHLPVVFISGDADTPMAAQAMKAGAIEFLAKPVRHQDLLNAIQVAIGSTSPAPS